MTVDYSSEELDRLVCVGADNTILSEFYSGAKDTIDGVNSDFVAYKRPEPNEYTNLKYIRAKQDGYMDDGELFCVEGAVYKVYNSVDKHLPDVYFIDSKGDKHYWNFEDALLGKCGYFEVVSEDEYNKIQEKLIKSYDNFGDAENTNQWTDKHYDNWYTLTPEDIEAGKVKIDAYMVNRAWRINSWDDTGAAFHVLKTLTRICNSKNSLDRELTALQEQIKCLVKLHKGAL